MAILGPKTLPEDFKIENPLGRTRVDDPERCQATIRLKGQCIFRSVEGSRYCPCHGGNNAIEAAKKQSLFRYRLAKYQVRLDEFTDSNSIKSLRDEIALLRFLVQKRLDFCKDGSELLMHSTILGRLIMTIQSLSETCLKVEKSLDALIDQEDAVGIAHELVLSIKAYCVHSPTVDAISAEFVELLQRRNESSEATFVSNYKIRGWQEELSSYITHEKVNTIRGEIGVLRLIVEERLNACPDNVSLLYESGPILELIGKIEKLVKSCHRLENSMGLLLDKEEAVQFAHELISSLSDHIKDGAMLEKIANRFQETFDG